MAIISTTRLFVPILLSCLIAPAAFAESGRADYDLDDDGLIEINSLADLDEIRNNLDGTSLYGESTGCPEAGCNGFELTTTLDFDTNADGKMDENDAYWNGGEGWVPIGDFHNTFISIFDGGHNEIRNLYINRPDAEYIGLFASAGDYDNDVTSIIRNLGLTGGLAMVSGGENEVVSYVGGFVGFAQMGTSISSCYNAIDVVAKATAKPIGGGLVGKGDMISIVDSYNLGDVSGSTSGGLVGYLSDSNIENSFSVAVITGDYNAGGIVGTSQFGIFSNVFSTGSVDSDKKAGGLSASNAFSWSIANYVFSVSSVNGGEGYKVGGLVGVLYDKATIINSHWAIDTSGQLTSDGESDIDNYFGATLAELQCPTSSDDTECLMNYTLYPTWDSAIWDFGTSSELPGLIIDGVVYRDGDGDGALDANHAPEVAFVLTQNGDEVYDITIGDGDVTLEAVITDQDASDHHTLSWTYEGVTVVSETDTSVTFSSDNLIVGDYTVSAVVTDNRFPVMSGNSEITFSVEAAPVEPNPSPEVTPSSKSSGGGSMNLYWLILISGLLSVGRRTVYCGITKI
ncbi:MAG: hypothetical protein KBT77_15340 [Thalassolituus oleivorans]|uniref:hypothetical protein n=1 Tax=Thalassolituus oleivorans TaxID=187493 RepID=UPI001B4E6CFA|nr:hypothetical protein [Thalassolituus oleivorans]MBQ0728717.1 hypothetical protein [Thalassolituus oleivorans]MBQ0779397.1 hypothetical protein [Thalassolituus oleivorans]